MIWFGGPITACSVAGVAQADHDGEDAGALDVDRDDVADLRRAPIPAKPEPSSAMSSTTRARDPSIAATCPKETS